MYSSRIASSPSSFARLLVAAGRVEGLRGLDPPLALALEHLELLVVGQRPLEVLLGRAQAREDQAQRVAALGVARERRLLDVLLDLAR